MAGVQGHEVGVGAGFVGHVGDDADAQAQPHIGLDHVRIDGGQHHIRFEALRLEGLVQLGTPREAEGVGDDGVAGHVAQREPLDPGQRVVGPHEHAAVPVVAGQHHQFVEMLDRFGGNGEIGLAAGGDAGNLRGRALVQVQRHPGVALPKGLNGVGQGIARLGVGGGNGQGAAVARCKVVHHPLDVVHVLQDALDDVQHRAAGGGDVAQVLAAAHEDLGAQLFFQQFQLLADTRLAGEQLLGRGRDVQIVADDFVDVAQLAEFHDGDLRLMHWGELKYRQ